jgi:hypothetical protein
MYGASSPISSPSVITLQAVSLRIFEGSNLNRSAAPATQLAGLAMTVSRVACRDGA